MSNDFRGANQLRSKHYRDMSVNEVDLTYSCIESLRRTWSRAVRVYTRTRGYGYG